MPSPLPSRRTEWARRCVLTYLPLPQVPHTTKMIEKYGQLESQQFILRAWTPKDWKVLFIRLWLP
ncbi:hypothetical protein BC936DRAFT_143102 [Jimgerdemannia flammicorona]|uniref:Uncharacterized protein n=1 Tax=Jimgerdemannia flammicorona TaxID=994334 RepID=A0A432ZZE5_9FUNG|nr:hypothetical protein BC936DRAFT_143102 [Jimgerdemannia flammicorona]